jgi:hypothetical protein
MALWIKGFSSLILDMVDSSGSPLAAIAALLQEAGIEVNNLSPDYSPWREEYWSPSVQALLREQMPELAEALIQRDLALPDTLQRLLLDPQNPYLSDDLELQRLCERYFPATCLRWQRAMGNPILSTADPTAHARQIIARRESTADLYTYRPDGQKVRRSFFVDE